MADEPGNEEKTEEATPRRREEARERGQVAFSSELMAGTMLAAAGIAFLLAGPRLAHSLGRIVQASTLDMASMGTEELTVRGISASIGALGRAVLPAFLFLVTPMLVVGAIAAFSQVGFKISTKAVSLDMTKLDPVKGVKRVFSTRSIVRTVMAGAKISAVLMAAGAVAWFHVGRMSTMTGGDLGPPLAGVGIVLARVSLSALIVIVVLAVIDVIYQRFQHTRDLRMSKKEVREEHKSTEGDPHVRARIRQIQREMATRRMMDDVPDATVVVTNPTHFAVALSYDGGLGGAPVVVAKGVGEVARNIKDVARDAGVLVYEDPPLARALHRQVEIGDEIPEELFQAVANVLAYVYRVQGKTASV
ncbi:MAG: flagellar biosynthesis protein FlhB [bacterium]|nr:flagellar biosynthesis protein FlhB [bacterium]